jgi:hypothetical protein
VGLIQHPKSISTLRGLAKEHGYGPWQHGINITGPYTLAAVGCLVGSCSVYQAVVILGHRRSHHRSHRGAKDIYIYCWDISL